MQKDQQETQAPESEAVVNLDIAATPEDVWYALSTDAGLAGWMGEGSSIGAEPGDALYVHDIVTGEEKHGFLDELTPSRRLGYTWWPEEAPDQATRVAISLEPCEVGTRVTVVETRPTPATATAPSAMASAGSAWAWRTALLLVAAQSVAVLTR